MIFPLIAQEGLGSNWLWYLLPLACCLLTMTQRGEDYSQSAQDSDTFYTSLSIEDSFKEVDDRIELWRIDAKENESNEKGIAASIRKMIGGRKKTERFTVVDKTAPRLLNLNDVTGSIYFEFTPVEDGGTVVKVTYSQLLRGRMKRMKADLPVKIPATPIGLKCPSCGKPVLHEFNLCPYCGTKLIKE